jgi:hypothetical protein
MANHRRAAHSESMYVSTCLDLLSRPPSYDVMKYRRRVSNSCLPSACEYFGFLISSTLSHRSCKFHSSVSQQSLPNPSRKSPQTKRMVCVKKFAANDFTGYRISQALEIRCLLMNLAEDFRRRYSWAQETGRKSVLKTSSRSCIQLLRIGALPPILPAAMASSRFLSRAI